MLSSRGQTHSGLGMLLHPVHHFVTLHSSVNWGHIVQGKSCQGCQRRYKINILSGSSMWLWSCTTLKQFGHFPPAASPGDLTGTAKAVLAGVTFCGISLTPRAGIPQINRSCCGVIYAQLPQHPCLTSLLNCIFKCHGCCNVLKVGF